MADAMYRFPEGFLWGTATAAHHVEGNCNNSWSHWENLEKGIIYQNQKHGIAVDWWGGRWREDFDRMQYLGHNTHRLSIEWSRIEPQPGVIDDTAIRQYREMLEALRARGIRPMVTLHHFTNPMWLEDEGGWVVPSVVERFEHWTQLAVEAFGDIVDLWCTFNEPMVYAVQAYLVGFFYPGKRNPWKMYQAAEMLLRAHAAAYQVIKSAYPQSEVGLAKHIVIFDTIWPHCINRGPVWLARRIFNQAFIDALSTGEVKFPLRRRVTIPEITNTLDYIGLNYYQRYRGGFSPTAPKTFFLTQIPDPDSPPSPPMWGEIYPQGTFEVIKYMWKQLRKPIYITETGTPDFGDDVRRWYIPMAVREVWRAINFNIPVKGIYYWTLMDNFEWIAAYNPEFRFGLYATDFETQARTLRRSGELYRAISLANGLSSEMVREYIPELTERLFQGQPGQSEVNLSA